MIVFPVIIPVQNFLFPGTGRENLKCHGKGRDRKFEACFPGTHGKRGFPLTPALCLAGEEEEDPYSEIVFSGLVMRIGEDEGSLEDSEKLWQFMLEEEARAEEGESTRCPKSLVSATLNKSAQRNSLAIEAISEEGEVHEDRLEYSLGLHFFSDSGFLEQSPGTNLSLQINERKANLLESCYYADSPQIIKTLKVENPF